MLRAVTYGPALKYCPGALVATAQILNFKHNDILRLIDHDGWRSIHVFKYAAFKVYVMCSLGPGRHDDLPGCYEPTSPTTIGQYVHTYLCKCSADGSGCGSSDLGQRKYTGMARLRKG